MESGSLSELRKSVPLLLKCVTSSSSWQFFSTSWLMLPEGLKPISSTCMTAYISHAINF